MAEYAFTYPSELASEAIFLDDMTEISTECGFGDDLRQAFMVVLSEAFTNALVHGNRSDPSRSVHVRVEVTNSVITADIADEGKWGLEQLQRRRPAPPLADHGRGLALIKHYAKEIEFSQAETGGLKVTVRFDRESNKITS